MCLPAPTDNKFEVFQYEKRKTRMLNRALVGFCFTRRNYVMNKKSMSTLNFTKSFFTILELVNNAHGLSGFIGFY
jgi:hypothetical protein